MIEWNYLIEKIPKANNIVYRYIDIYTNEIVYVGIVTDSNLPTRHKAHCRDNWYKDGVYLLEYIEVENKSEAEAIETHLINLYNTGKYYNKAKVGWGLNKYLPNEYEWKTIIPTINDVIKQMKQIALTYECSKRKISPSTMNEYAEQLLYIEKLNDYFKVFKAKRSD